MHQITQEFRSRELNCNTHTSCHLGNSREKGRDSINEHCRKECKLQPSFQFLSGQQYIRPLPFVQIREFWVFSLLMPSGCTAMGRRDTCSGWEQSMQKKCSDRRAIPCPILLHHKTAGLKQQFTGSCLMWLLLKGSSHQESLISSFSSAWGRCALTNTHWSSWKRTSDGSGLGLRLNSQTLSQPDEGGAKPGIL